MHKSLLWVWVVVLAVPAGASVEVFFTTSEFGLTDPAYAFLPTNGNQTDIDDGTWLVGTYPPAMSNPTVGVGDTVYVWFKFNGEPNGRRVNYLDVNAVGAAQAAWYILDDTAGANGDRRWNGAYTPPHAPEFQTIQKELIASTAFGLKNLNSSLPQWLYRGGAYRTSLLGAVRYSTPGTYTLDIEVAPPCIECTYSDEIIPPDPAPPVIEIGTVTVTPEPAGVWMAGMLALLGISVGRR